jgi:hypothetical protein
MEEHQQREESDFHHENQLDKRKFAVRFGEQTNIKFYWQNQLTAISHRSGSNNNPRAMIDNTFKHTQPNH